MARMRWPTRSGVTWRWGRVEVAAGVAVAPTSTVEEGGIDEEEVGTRQLLRRSAGWPTDARWWGPWGWGVVEDGSDVEMGCGGGKRCGGGGALG